MPLIEFLRWAFRLDDGETFMLLKRAYIFLPIGLALAISATFWITQLRYFNVIGWNYDFCHALFGFTFPLFLSYLGFFSRASMQKLKWRQVVRGLLAVPLVRWPLSLLRLLWRSIVRDFSQGIPWTPWVGVAITLSFSIGNEVFLDPVANGVPFFRAYGHFVADLLGMAAFLLSVRLAASRRRHSEVALSGVTTG